ncbi:MAG: biotin/lipoyl-containing protein [Desulfoprunum sp.]|nr:biotin/lipoyl-containing protein [Desulfoprunum sp.]
MKMFRIRVNGNEYEVEVEEITNKSGVSPIQTAQNQRPSPVQKINSRTPTAATAPTAPVQEGTTTILAPMPGTIVDVQVSPGDKVSRGQTLMILEAMKMENEILAPHDCTIVQTHVSKGASVNAGDILVALS